MLVPAHGNDFVFPFNPIYNYNLHCGKNCLVMMFIAFESKGKLYPILFDYWISEVYYDEDEQYFTKDEIFIRSVDYLIKSGLNIETMLFDAGFFHKAILTKLSGFGIEIVTRCPKGRLVTTNKGKQKAKDIFFESYNGDFYYFHRYESFINSAPAEVLGKPGQIVGIANNRKGLLEKNLFFLFSSNLELTAPEILRLYKTRWKIESFFKILKSYLSLSVFYRNNYEYVNERINLALAGFIVIQEMASRTKRSFYQTLKLFQDGKLEDLFQQAFKSTSSYFCYYCV